MALPPSSSRLSCADLSHLEFDKLNRLVAKIIASDKAPKIYIKTVADLEDFMNETIAKQKVSTKKMNATNAKGLNAMKQKIKRNNREHAVEIEKYREAKGEYMFSDDEEEVVQVEKPKKSKTVITDGLDIDDDEGFATVGRGGKPKQYTPESILKHLRSIIQSRGKKNTDRTDQIRTMERLFEVAETPYQKIRVLLTLIATRFDLTTGSTATFMSQEQWNSAEQEFGTLLEVLEENRNMVVLENAEEWEDDEKAPVPTPGEKLKIPGSVVSMIERLDDELTRSLQHIDPHTAEYIERLSDEQALYNKIIRALLYVEELKKDQKLEIPQESANRIVMRRVEHIYFKVWESTFDENSFTDSLTAFTSRQYPRRDSLEFCATQFRLEYNPSWYCTGHCSAGPNSLHLPLREQHRYHPWASLPMPSLLLRFT